MRTSKCILFTAIGTILSLLYVFQQTEIVKLGYRITSAQKVLEAAQDRQTSLAYALSSLESPLSLDKSLSTNKEQFEIAQKYKLVKLTTGQKAPESARIRTARKKTSPVSKRFAFHTLFAGSQAEAKTIK